MEVDIEHFSIEIGAARLAHEYGDVLMAGAEKDDAMAVFDKKDEICGRLPLDDDVQNRMMLMLPVTGESDVVRLRISHVKV